ncbi:hypothetical protein SeGA_4717 [Salmonella enterica subsp. enterica serovar Gaminara str. A4-567]|nr:hypothetical protein SeGA_4717 [Salmonella enterica subsp. enterica serovar Gaminara str. A4-567]
MVKHTNCSDQKRRSGASVLIKKGAPARSGAFFIVFSG